MTDNPRAGWDCYRRFIDMFGDVVMGPSTSLSHEHFEEAISVYREFGADAKANHLQSEMDTTC